MKQIFLLKQMNLNLTEDGSVLEPLSLFEEIIISLSYHLFEYLTNIVVDYTYGCSYT